MTNLVSISSVVAGEHPEGATVTITGVLNGMQAKKTKQGNEWARFVLIGEKTAVDVDLLPLYYREFRDLIGPVKDPDGHAFTNLRPPTLTLTGEVRPAGWPSHRPSVHVTAVVCAEHVSHAPHPPLPLVAPARIALSSLVSAARGLREAVAADKVTPVGELIGGVLQSFGEVQAALEQVAQRDDEGRDAAILLARFVGDTTSLRNEATS